ncbi:sulfotransferase domain-containing protein [Pseudoalteromonas distincta]|uniref:sulfotransferase domain-containing protein n=1 Tax=Pseudoalteromonas distincta TaxID=77608 RepID=UPI0011F2AEC2|nr:sulfotransferase domain-containing protein [Pseudoalteromonas distincta]KAA1162949.1 sulfotransferase domain-containing protein [Pseudoalteromonas distincta]
MINIIFGGSTKCATTSLYNYFSEHPEISIASTKEVRYFISSEYPLKQPHFDRGQSYQSLFQEGKCYSLDATPDYLYEYTAPQRISESCEKPFIIFILRNPIDRMRSWFNFAKQTNQLPNNASMKEFIDSQVSTYLGKNQAVKQYQLALEQNDYKKYLEKYFQYFPQERVLIFDFDKIKNQPYYVVKEICKVTGINFEYFNDYEFSIHNQTVNLKSPKVYEYYSDFCEFLRGYLNRFSRLRKVLKKIKLQVDKLLFFILANSNASNVCDDEERLLRVVNDRNERDWKEILDKYGR